MNILAKDVLLRALLKSGLSDFYLLKELHDVLRFVFSHVEVSQVLETFQVGSRLTVNETNLDLRHGLALL